MTKDKQNEASASQEAAKTEAQTPPPPQTQVQTKPTTPKEIVYKCQEKFDQVVKASGLQLIFEKESGYALQAISNNPFILKCSVESIQQAVLNVALTGLTLNPKLAYCYIVPRGGKAVLDISYQGLMFIMTNQLNVRAIHSDVIYKNDEFEYSVNESGTHLKHTPNKFEERGEILGAYAIAYLQNGLNVAVVLNNKEIEDIKATSQAAGTSFSPWSGSETIQNEMRKKTAVRRLWKMVPKTQRVEEAAQTISIDDENHDATFKKSKASTNFDNITIEEQSAEIIQ